VVLVVPEANRRAGLAPAGRWATFTRKERVRHLLTAYDLNADNPYGHVKLRKDRYTFLACCHCLRSLHPSEVRIAIGFDNIQPSSVDEALRAD
jgi:hypothetical protein